MNYGVPEDYEQLERLGISVKGAIVIARYGGSWRGIKPKVAAEHGAIGCLIYSDPHDDGYFRATFSRRAPGASDGVQRGSVMDMPVYPGDPLTPGIGATADAKRLAVEGGADHHENSGASDFVWRCPAAARSAGRSALRRQAGAARLPSPITSGPGPAKVHLKVKSNWDVKPIYNVIARIAGVDLPGRMDRARQSSRRLGERRGRSGLRRQRPARRSPRFR